MKISSKRFCENFLLLFYIIENHFLYLVPISNTIIKYILLALCLLFYLYLLLDNNNEFKSATVFFKMYVLLCIPLFLFVQFIHVEEKYNASIIDFLKGAYHYCFIFLSPAFYYVFKHDKSPFVFIEKLVTLINVNLLFHIINSVIYNFTKKSLLFITVVERENSLRTYSISTMLGLSIVYTMWRLFYENDKTRKSVIEFIITLVAVFYCYRSRIIEIITILLLFLLISYQKERKKSHIFVFFIEAMAVVAFIQLGYLDKLIDSARIGGTYSSSTSTRLNEIEYYWAAFKNSPIMGLGLVGIDTSIGQEYHECYGRFTMADVGYIGAIANMGFSYLVPFGLFIALALNALLKLKQNQHDNMKGVYILGKCFMVYVLTSGLFQIITDRQRMILLPFLLAFYEFVKNESIEIKTNNQENNEVIM